MISLAQTRKYARQGADQRLWYWVANQSICTAYPDSWVKCCAIMAITSPNVHVARNVAFTKALMHGVDPPDMMSFVRAAVRRYLTTGIIKGDKTNEFAHALWGDTNAVVVDRWIYRIMCPSWKHPTPRRYGLIKDQIQRASKGLGWNPCETQAAIWATARRKAGKRAKWLVLS